MQLLSGAFSAARELECQIITDFAKLQEFAPVWNELWHSNPRAEIFQSFVWARAWWQCFGDRFRLCVPVVYDAGQAALVLPLAEHEGTLRFLGWPQADYSDMLCSHSRPAELLAIALRCLLRDVPGWKECLLEHLRPDSELLNALSGLPRDLRRLIRLQGKDSCPTIIFGENRSAVIEPLLTGKHARRRLHNLRKAGALTFRHLENKEEAHRHLTDFFRCHRRRCALLAKISCFEEPEMRSMMQALVEELDLRRELRLGVLELNGRPLAWSLGFQVNGKYSYYQQTFDVDKEDYAPGEVLLHYLLLYAKDSVDRELDFLRGDEFFKRRFATHVKQTQTLSFQRGGLYGELRRTRRFVQAQLHAVSQAAEGFVRTHEKVFQVSRSICMRKRNLLQRLQRAKMAGALMDYLLLSASQLVRRAIWSGRPATLFVKQDDGTLRPLPPCVVAAPGIEIVTGHFSDLIDLALEHPEISFPPFRECRTRLKRGDRVYLIRENGKIALVAWAGVRPLNDRPEGPAPRPTTDGSVALAMYECWPIQNPEAGCTRLLKLLGQEASEAKSDLVVCCPEVPSKSQRELQEQGFLPKSQIVGHTVLSCLHWNTVRDCSTTAEQQPADSICPKLRNGRRT